MQLHVARCTYIIASQRGFDNRKFTWKISRKRLYLVGTFSIIILKDFFLQSEVIWFSSGVILMLLELVAPGLVLLFFGIGAWLTAIACLIWEPGINTQLFIFLIGSLASLLLLRRAIKKRYIDTDKDAVGFEDEYIGATAVAINAFNTGQIGKVSFKGSTWEATTSSPVIEGQLLKITGYKSIRLFVEPLQHM